jgi:hypothetical protein
MLIENTLPLHQKIKFTHLNPLKLILIKKKFPFKTNIYIKMVEFDGSEGYKRKDGDVLHKRIKGYGVSQVFRSQE